MNDTIFGKIIRGEIPATKVYEDEHCVAFLDISPINIGHTLVVPRVPYKNIFELPEEILAHLFSVAQKIAEVQKSALGADGVNIMMNNDAAAGQVVFHAHIHVIPRYAGDGYEHWHSKRPYEQGEAEIVAEKIKSNL